MQYREIGKTGEKISIVGLGGVTVMRLQQSEADSLVAEAVDRGVNYIDVAPSYEDAEERLGPALVGKRDKFFLACKTGQRTKKEAEEELNRTLSRLKTDHADLYQMHGLDSPEELATALGPGGAMEAFEAAKAAGKIRYIGITGHSVENLISAIKTGRYSTVLYPINFSQFEIANYGPELLETAKTLGIGRMGIKAAAERKWNDDQEREELSPKCWYRPLMEDGLFKLALRYTLSQDISAALPPGDVRLFKLAVDVAEDFKPINAEGLAELREASGQLEPLFARA